MNTLFAVLLCLSGNVYQDFFEQGNDAYAENRLDDAILAYERLVSSGVKNAAIFYNLGNAYYHGDDIGRAVLNYERALLVDSNFDPALRGLEAVEVSIKGTLSLPTGFRPLGGWKSLWGYRILWGFLLTFWWLLWGILLLSQRHPIPHARSIVLAVLLAVLLLGGAVYARSQTPDPAVILVSDSPMRYGPDERDGLRSLLGAGTCIRVEKIEGAWARIETGTGLRGWVRTEHLGAVNPPFRSRL